TMVDSLERNIKDSLSFVGRDVLYVQKWPLLFGGDYPWWKYFQRPAVTLEEYKFLERNLESASAMSMIEGRGGITLKNGNNSLDAQVQGISYDFNQITEVPVENGRYFSPQEVEAARNVAIVGAEIAETLFPGSDPVGKEFKLKGVRFQVIGVQEKKGRSTFDIGGNPDTRCYLPYLAYMKLFHTRYSQPYIAVKGFESDAGLLQLESEITGLLRTRRGLRPSQEDSFSINRLEAGLKAISGVFSVLTLAGWVIGSFSILVGGFGIANIMFVSVKERTKLIGIQKSLGAKNYFILFQFLFEAIVLSLIGGLVGLLLVLGITFVPLGTLDVVLSWKNIVLGLGVSSVIGVASGILPAIGASRLDPVIAIRAK
ncbi:MAG: ABC transporter permease, partial [Cytophagaceae bacterium]|nr:ABC transporter permease [Cytophagaceae bacterium]